MASFVVYDLVFLVLFTLLVGAFLYKRRANLQRQGLLYLYRTKVGIKIMDWTNEKFGKILKPLQYVIVASGYILMVVMIYMLAKFTYIYTKFDVAREIKIPPILPLFPYATDLFKVDFLPPFYFTYWIIIIAIIAVSHEFAHGIFARLNKIKVHSTGFGFLGPFLAAFVEPDEKQMEKAKKFPQLSILAAGTFANVLMTILFGIILWGFFAASFTPAGVNFNAYPDAIIPLASITSVAGQNFASLDQVPEIVDEGLNEIEADGVKYLIPDINLLRAIEDDFENLVVFEDAPAARADLKGPILEADGRKITEFSILSEIITSHNPGEIISLVVLDENDERVSQNIVLGDREGKAYLGIGIREVPRKGLTGFIYSIAASVKNPLVYYEAKWNGDLALFIYNLLWWTVLINISVALVNMLPVGIFDGGRFFYLTVWGLTGSKKFSEKAFAFMTWLIILTMIWLMVIYFLAFV
jgi:membrane-associated protease RseP (regulator of RpoE activity)